MIIAIAANENHATALVDPHFGKCNWYCIYDTETSNSEFVENPARHRQEKAGQEAAAFLIARHIHMAVSGRFGTKVAEVFRKSHVQMIIPETNSTITDIIHQIK
jgi:predicted Fe-Mo cluster-binding NifX family protein